MGFRQYRKIQDGEPWGRDVAVKLNSAMGGKLNVVNEITLDANADSTDLVDELIFPDSLLQMTPRTATAQAITWRQGATVRRQITIHHTNDANADKTFRYAIWG